MCLQGGGPIEGLVAYVALVGFLGGVNNFMSAECTGQPESFATYGANKRLGAGMSWHFHMDGQRVLSLEGLAALITSVRRFACSVVTDDSRRKFFI